MKNNIKLFLEVFAEFLENSIDVNILDDITIKNYEWGQIRVGPGYYYKTIKEMLKGENLTDVGLYMVDYIYYNGTVNYNIGLVKEINVRL